MAQRSGLITEVHSGRSTNTMDLSQLTSIANSGASRVATALAPKTSHATAKATTSTDSSTSDSSTTSTDNTNISANDFLTLLVSELKNQDPTQPTDPTTYIQQLVGVNSLQQLIQINQGLTQFEDAVLG
jgi:flagellar basal-body rod modification protein FlgD